MRPDRTTAVATPAPRFAVPVLPVGSTDPKEKTLLVISRRGRAFNAVEEDDALSSQGGVA